jgi:hypothetical protein
LLQENDGIVSLANVYLSQKKNIWQDVDFKVEMFVLTSAPE